MRTTLAFRRVAATLVFVATLVLGSSAGVAADSQGGQHGHADFRDQETAPEVTCVYTGPNSKLTSIVVRPPRVWWPDTDSSNDRQHGKVGWRAYVQSTTDSVGGPWTTVKKSTVRKATAYEDQPFGDPADAAHFTKWTVSWSAPHDPTLYVRVVVHARWYNPNGSLKGWVKHNVVYYRIRTNGVSDGAFTNQCNNYGLAG